MQILIRNLTRRASSVRKMARSILACVIIFMLSATNIPFQGETVIRENKVKAVFLYNFTQFVAWPAESFTEETSPVVIGILGKDTFSEYLTEIIEGETVNNRPIVIKKFHTSDPEIEHCQILFIEKSASDIGVITGQIKNKPVLTVSDHEEFMKENGMLRFYVESDKVRFEINRDAALNAGLEISPKLLKLATIYKKRK
jgi:hypothetical protein